MLMLYDLTLPELLLKSLMGDVVPAAEVSHESVLHVRPTACGSPSEEAEPNTHRAGSQ